MIFLEDQIVDVDRANKLQSSIEVCIILEPTSKLLAHNDHMGARKP